VPSSRGAHCRPPAPQASLSLCRENIVSCWPRNPLTKPGSKIPREPRPKTRTTNIREVLDVIFYLVCERNAPGNSCRAIFLRRELSTITFGRGCAMNTSAYSRHPSPTGSRRSGTRRGDDRAMQRQSVSEDQRTREYRWIRCWQEDHWAQASYPRGHNGPDLGSDGPFGGDPRSGRSEGSVRENQERPPTSAVGLGRWRLRGQVGERVKSECGWVLEIVKRTEDINGFKLLPSRWVVERTFA
jgi:hypothetical protein